MCVEVKKPVMEKLMIEATEKSPLFACTPYGHMVIDGRSTSEKIEEVFGEVIEWCKKASVDEVVLSVNLEYMNSSTSRQMVSLMQALDENQMVKEVFVNWYYDEGNTDIYDKGFLFMELFGNLSFSFKTNYLN